MVMEIRTLSPIGHIHRFLIGSALIGVVFIVDLATDLIMIDSMKVIGINAQF